MNYLIYHCMYICIDTILYNYSFSINPYCRTDNASLFTVNRAPLFLYCSADNAVFVDVFGFEADLFYAMSPHQLNAW